jgi:hypothetical protein
MSETVQMALIMCVTFIAITVLNNVKDWFKK